MIKCPKCGHVLIIMYQDKRKIGFHCRVCNKGFKAKMKDVI